MLKKLETFFLFLDLRSFVFILFYFFRIELFTSHSYSHTQKKERKTEKIADERAEP